MDNRIIMDSHGMFGFQVFLMFLDKRHICNILLQDVAIISSTSITSPEMANSFRKNQPACRSGWITFPLGHSWRLKNYLAMTHSGNLYQLTRCFLGRTWFGTRQHTTTSGSHRDLQLRRVTVFELQSLGLL